MDVQMLCQLHMTSRELLFLHLCSEVQKKRQKRDGRPILCYLNNPMHTAQGTHNLHVSVIASFFSVLQILNKKG